MVLSATLPASLALTAADAPATAPVRYQAELSCLLQRLGRLVQEMGDRGLEPDGYAPARELRPAFLRLTAAAVRLAERLNLSEGNPADYLSDLLVAHLRRTSGSARLAQLSLPQALGEQPGP